MGDLRQHISQLVLGTIFVGMLASIGTAAQQPSVFVPKDLTASDPKLIYRLDLVTGKLAPIERSDLKVGYIYYHFSTRRNAWAWSYLQKDGSFWYAFGEGTTQAARRFDIRGTQEEIANELKKFPELAKQVDQYRRAVCLQLQADGRWKIAGVGLSPSMFNAETGERWQKFAKDEYIPVVHVGGTIWVVRNGEYYPSGSFSSGR